MVDALNYLDDLAPMYVVVGNHESDRCTSEHLVNAIPASRFEWLGDNYHFETGDARTDSALRSTFVIKHEDKTIGIFALTLRSSGYAKIIRRSRSLSADTSMNRSTVR